MLAPPVLRLKPRLKSVGIRFRLEAPPDGIRLARSAGARRLIVHAPAEIVHVIEPGAVPQLGRRHKDVVRPLQKPSALAQDAFVVRHGEQSSMGLTMAKRDELKAPENDHKPLR